MSLEEATYAHVLEQISSVCLQIRPRFAVLSYLARDPHPHDQDGAEPQSAAKLVTDLGAFVLQLQSGWSENEQANVQPSG